MKIERKKISAQILEQLKELIKENKFSSEQPFPSENELATMFGVSRAPVREALSVLAASGIIESRQGGRSFVREVRLASMLETLPFEVIPVEQIYEVLEMRIIIETKAASLAALRHDANDLREIEKALNDFQVTLINMEAVGAQADVNFHKHIMNATKNKFLIQVMENIDELYRKTISFTLAKNVGFPDKREQVFQEHENIFLAIKRRDGKEAELAMRTHLENVEKKLKLLHQK
ncbi:FadR/GntR family transcriptional regulator [Jeotgalibacillus soli]|uniref:GntR family transcriptional regulator n=1 Tax=Jeotgalibacillus soli TaxID=889306 RepID=A0A0C2VP77_9BACL|nr:FadR/GntR family transcriptional regulator [Jeotgalibacillus soli]KIL45813.1 GntR family transcriptional regulator [Jeotgalibacillus soli]